MPVLSYVHHLFDVDQPGCKRYWCHGCRRTFNDLTNTLLHQSKRALPHWILASRAAMASLRALNRSSLCGSSAIALARSI